MSQADQTPEYATLKHDEKDGYDLRKFAERRQANERQTLQPDPMRDALDAARNGLQWYRDMYPEADSGADDEMMAQIDSALAGTNAIAPMQHGNAQDLWLQQADQLNCPHCGGSGHVDDGAGFRLGACALIFLMILGGLAGWYMRWEGMKP